jgi:hypothetical protein
MNNNEGPHEVIIPSTRFTSCSGCKYFNRRLVKSGRNPIYASNCEHPEIREEVKRFGFEGNLQENNLGIVETPNWCPYLNPKKNEAAETTF